MYTRDQVLDALRQALAPGDIPRALEMLDQYGVAPGEPERERVQLAVLRLCRGDLDQLRHFVEAARRDYRDVLLWAESPEAPAVLGPILEILRDDWSWALPQPLRIVAINPFGNVVVSCVDGHLWRVCPEELQTVELAAGEDFNGLLADTDFREDWEFAEPAAAAAAALGPLAIGQCYGFKVWPVLGGGYDEGNYVIKLLEEWLSASGQVGRQVKDMPDGTRVEIKVTE